MEVVDYAAVQAALRARGFDRLGESGPRRDGVDGDFGPLSQAMLRRFQRACGLPATGIVDAASLRALGLPPMPAMPPWFQEARARAGWHERRDNAQLAAYLRAGGEPIDPAVVPWCAAFVEVCIRKTLPAEPIPAGPLWAPNWIKAGLPLAVPALGAIMVFTGHVAFYAGEMKGDPRWLRSLGGNQADAVNEVWFPRGQLTSLRWPRTFPRPAGGPVYLSGDGNPISPVRTT